MRFEAVKAVYERGLKDESLYFITSDLGHTKTEEFRKDFGERYLNAGMSEQNILGVAAGLALSGMKAVVYSIVPFVTLRPFEQIKIDVCNQNADVTIIGIGGGFAYESAGPTHFSIEEIAALRALPNMKVVCPANPMETRQLTKQILEIGGPTYMRIGRGKEPNPEKEYEVEFGKAKVLRDGDDITIISSGTIVTEALRAAEMLNEKGISAEVLNMHTIKPLDIEAISGRIGNRKGIFTLEEHSVIGGLGSAVAEVLSESPVGKVLFKRFGVEDKWPETVGSQAYLRDIAGISAEKVVENISQILKQK